MGASGFFEYPTEPDGEQGVPGADPDVRAPFLHEADELEWAALLSFTQTRYVSAGEHVFTEGETDHALYLLTAGRLELSTGGERVGELEAIAPLNQIGFFDLGPCAITATALDKSELVRLSFEAFEALAARKPVLARKLLLAVGQSLAVALRAV